MKTTPWTLNASGSALLAMSALGVAGSAPPIPDLAGTWVGRGDPIIARLTAVKNGASICVVGCAAPGAARAGGDGLPVAEPGAPSGFPKYKPQFQARVKDLSDRQVETDASLRCQLPGVPRIGPPAKIVQTAREVIFLYDDLNGSFYRIIPTDGRAHRKDVSPNFLGDAIGHYEGDTLVVETQNFNDETWLTDNGAFHTTDLKVVERLRRAGNTIEWTATAYDPAVLVEPWNARARTLQRATADIEEAPRCDDRTIPKVVDGSHHDNPR